MAPDNPDLPSIPRDSGPVFWKEIYWFVIISLGGWILALLVLTPRLSRNATALAVEGDLRATVTRLAGLEAEYEAAIQSVESDPFYRDEVLRAVLGVKKKGEEFLKEPGPAGR